MNFSAAIPTFVITLREGVEAALVVGIVLAYIKKAQQPQLKSWVYGGVVVGIVTSAFVGLIFGWIVQSLSASNPKYAPVLEPLMEGTFSIIAIAMLSWMLIWMTQQARFLKAEVEGAVSAALKQDGAAAWGIFSLICVAVLREGFETVLFILAKFQQGWVPAVGAVAGLLTAVGIGVLLFKWGIRINIRQFFKIMGILLLLIVAGLVISALGHFDTAIRSLAQMDRQSESLCFYYERFTKDPSCILGPMVWNTAKVLSDDKFPGIILHTLFGYTDKLYQVQAIAYVGFLATVGSLYFRSLTGQAPLPTKNGKGNVGTSEKPIPSRPR